MDARAKARASPVSEEENKIAKLPMNRRSSAEKLDKRPESML